MKTTMMYKSGWLLLFWLSCANGWAAPAHSPWPGGIGVVRIDGDAHPTVTINSKPALVYRDEEGWVALIGIPLDHDPAAPLTARVTRPDGREERISVELDAASYRVQRLNVDRKYVEPDQESLNRIFAERKVIDAALSNWRAQELNSVALKSPVPGARSSSFGSRRIFNDQPRSPHKGMDITAVTGTPIRTPLDALVSATGDYYFNGNTVILDHGQGYVSLYCHLSKIDVDEGQRLAVGDVLGEVGATGRVTGAHLHFATYLNGTAVDPAILLEPSQD
ncbi:MAG: peptidoglycan DD-metalloendopeptidase family protein [Woeseiaceae bacterium]